MTPLNADTGEAWRPKLDDLRAACVILLASSLPYEARRVVREIYERTFR